MITKRDKSHNKFSVDNCIYSACFQKSINLRSTFNVIIVFFIISLFTSIWKGTIWHFIWTNFLYPRNLKQINNTFTLCAKHSFAFVISLPYYRHLSPICDLQLHVANIDHMKFTGTLLSDKSLKRDLVIQLE